MAHFPPGNSNWNEIEHRMFCIITRNWRGQPLVSYKLIVATTTGTGLTIRSDLDENSYPLGVKVTDDRRDNLPIRRDPSQGEWNYTLSPRPQRSIYSGESPDHGIAHRLNLPAQP